ncbi:hypothetical protein DFH06DRAFT_749342 [Mycena polygramma]|nr:hypothetical protein DFH06DRAFT_749342 [Mycena polygramma]
MSSQVPDELWLEIFGNLPTDALKDLSLTCHDLRRITRSLIFAHFDFHPYVIRDPYSVGEHNNCLLPADPGVAGLVGRLHFWSSEDIAPLVRTCDITPMQVATFGTSTVYHTTEQYALLDIFFERMPRFTGLRRLTTKYVDFPQTAMANLCRMPSLTSLDIMHFPAAREEPEAVPQALELSSFSLRHNIQRGDALAHWIPSLHPQHLRELRLLCRLLRVGDGIEAIPIFPYVHSLSMTMDFSTMVHNRAIMSKFPAVKVLSLWGWGEVEDGDGLNSRLELEDAPFPALEEYSGTHRVLSIFLTRATLTRVTITDGYLPGVIAQLQAGRSPVNITAFTADFFEPVDTFAFGILLRLLPRLTQLCVRVRMKGDEDAVEFQDGVNRHATTFFDALANTLVLPYTLEHLAFLWEFEFDAFAIEPTAERQPEFHELRDALVARSPALKTLWLDGHDFLYQWRKVRDGTCVEASADTYTHAALLRGNLSEFWTMR